MRMKMQLATKLKNKFIIVSIVKTVLKVSMVSVISIVAVVGGIAFSATRIKTVEWNFGSYYSATDIASGSGWTPPYIVVNLPENGIVIKNAYVEIEYLSSAGTAADVTNIDILFNAGTSPTDTVDNITGTQVPDSSGESNLFVARANVTSKITSWNNQSYSLRLISVGSPHNMHSAKLYITYEYDDTSPTQIKTVRFPLFSSSVDGTYGCASTEAQQISPVSVPFKYLCEIPESGITINQVWFEIRGLRQSGATTTDGSINVNISGYGNEPTMTLDGALVDTYRFRYLSSTGTPQGFSINTLQTVYVNLSGKANTNVLGGEVVITYEYPNTASTKLKTISYFFAQSTGTVGSVTNFTVPIYLNEEGITIKRIYALISGSYDSTTAGNFTVDSKISGNSLTQRNYSLVVTAIQISGFELYHDLSEGRSYWTNGSTVTISWPNNLAALGGCGVELIITYTYTSENKWTEFYRVFVGQTANEVASAGVYNYSPTIFFPDPEYPSGRKSLITSWLRGNFIEGDATVTQDPTTTINVNSVSGKAQIVKHHSTTENFQTT
ncbi:MAG: hypothetical protein ACK4JE_01705, partial [Endomicrobiia bacterium]